jgi:ferrous iron transport protein A
MNEKYIPLDMLPIGCRGIVKELKGKDNHRRRMLDLGLIDETVVKALCQNPSGDPVAYQIRGAVIALRSEEASNIIVKMV